jgi:predicted outer membrane protein
VPVVAADGDSQVEEKMLLKNMWHVLAALSLGTGACGVPSQNTQPRMPAGQPMTTGATMSEPSGVSPLVPGSPSLRDTSAGVTSGGAVASSGDGGTAVATTPDEVVGLSDAQIVAVVQTANHSEVERAHEALRKAESTRVKELAQHIVADDTAADERLARFDDKIGITPRTSAAAERLRMNGVRLLSSVKSSTSRADCDRLYVGAQLTEDAELLEILDDTLIPQAQDAELVRILHAIHAKVANHLRMAQDIETAPSRASQQ